MELHSDRWFAFDAPPARVWEAFARTDAYQRWWPWLADFRADGLHDGGRWQCTVSPPLPYLVRFSVELVEVRPPSRIHAAIDGDIRGTADLELTGAGAGSRLHLVSDLVPHHTVLRLAALAVRPIMRIGHDWVLDTGARQFADQAL